MADKKISQLTTGVPADADLIAFVDVANGITKKVTKAVFINWLAFSNEQLSGTIDGNNVTFTATHTPIQIFVSGQFLTNTVDYTVAGLTVTFVNAPMSGPIISFYQA